MSRDRRYLFRHLGAILVLPLNVLIVIPAAILLWTQGADPGWGLESPFRFGEPYRRYRANVPRGIPRRSVWQSS